MCPVGALPSAAQLARDVVRQQVPTDRASDRPGHAAVEELVIGDRQAQFQQATVCGGVAGIDAVKAAGGGGELALHAAVFQHRDAQRAAVATMDEREIATSDAPALGDPGARREVWIEQAVGGG